MGNAIMSITVDDREKGAMFVGCLPPGFYSLSRLEFGDVSIIGNGPDDIPILVGVERKSIGDLLNSITSGRFAGHQLPGLINSYSVVYMIVEGLYRPGPSGLLELRVGKGWEPVERGRRWMYREVECWLTTMEEKAGLRIRRSPGPPETAAIIQSLHQWWNSKDYAEHRAHLTLHRPHDTALLRKAGIVRVIAAELPGIGWTKSALVAQRFRTVADMVVADVKDWMTIDGIGSATAEKVVDAIYGMDRKAVKERRS